jgi:hypothetical protein
MALSKLLLAKLDTTSATSSATSMESGEGKSEQDVSGGSDCVCFMRENPVDSSGGVGE